ncbi:MAG TPA: sialate O-acetylesterase [Sphingomonas sp.]|jgi:sialate O-acetylesterase
MMLLSLALAMPASAQAMPRFDALFADHMVLQRDKPIRLRGTAPAGQPVTVEIDGQKATVRADTRGDWSATIPAMAAGGPFRLSVSDAAGRTSAIDDVMMGDVFLCGGQSNMSYLTRYATDASNQLKTPADPAIRFTTIPLDQPSLPRDRLKDRLRWIIAAPDTLGDTSAVCYYMALQLKARTGVTIGLVRSSLGGTPVQSWLSPAALRRLPPYGERVAALEAFAASPEMGRAAWQAHVARWWRTIDPKADAWAEPKLDDAAWDWAQLPGQRNSTRESMGGYFSGAIWYRHAAMLDAASAARIDALDLGTLGQDATLWINGRRIGAREGGIAGPYPVPRGVLRAGTNVIAVRLLDMGSDWRTRICPTGCAWREASGATRPLTPDWRYRVARRMPDLPLVPRTPWQGGRGLGTLYNGMIAPLTPLTFKGAIWYQGESNVADPGDYKRLLPALMRDWRDHFGDPALPFVVVQLSAFGPMAAAPTRSDWAELREVQRRAVAADPHSALVVSIDAGDRWDIHPAQKKVVGQRIARAMQRIAYGDAVQDGPQPIRAVRRGDAVVILFSRGGLRTLSSDRAIGFELCSPTGCAFADARVEGSDVVVAGAGEASTTHVRYAWANSPVVNLFGPDDTPVVPFQIDIDRGRDAQIPR